MSQLQIREILPYILLRIGYLEALLNRLSLLVKEEPGGFPSGPAVSNLPPNVGDTGLIPVRELRCHVPRGS